MEPIVNYLEDTEKKLMMEMSGLFNKMREQRNAMSIESIEDMYMYKPVEGVIYDPCVRIPCTNSCVKRYSITMYYGTAYKLPQDECIIFVKEFVHNGSQNSPASTYACIAITNYGRFIRTSQISENRQFGGYNSWLPSATMTIIKLDPLSYKLPTWFLQSFITHDVLYPDPNSQNSVFYPGTNQHPSTLTDSLNTTTNVLQELNKEFYLFAGKWRLHMTEHATLDVNKMRQTIIDNTNSIEELKGKGESLEQQNKILQAELKELKQQKTILEKEKARLLPLEKYKETVLEFMHDHYTNEEVWDNDDTLDRDIIRIFSNWHTNKVFMDKWVYDDVIESKEELSEYRIYKKVKGEMVSSGMDNSNVARNVLSIKTKMNKK